MTSNDRTDDILATLEGRPTAAQRAADDAAQARAEDMLDALRSGGPAPSRQDRRIAEALNGGAADPFKAARDARTVEALTGQAPRDADPLWMERAEVNMAAESYAASIMRRHPASETLDSATRRADRARDQFMDEHRPEHAEERTLLEATAAHLTQLAALDRQPAARSAESSAWSRAFRERKGTTTAASKTTRMTRIN